MRILVQEPISSLNHRSLHSSLKVLLGDDGLKVSVQLSRLYRLSYDRFDDRDNGYPMARDVLIMLWLRLIEAATHTFTLLIHADLKLNYQDTLSKLSAENRMDDGTVFVAETTELLTKLLLPSIPPLSDSVASIDDTVTAGVLAEFLTDDANSYETGVWLQKVRATIIRAELISGAETIDTIILFGRRRFDVQFGPDFEADLEPYTLTDMDAAGIRLALRYGSSLGLVSEDSVVATELARLICCDAGTQQLSESRPFDFTTCALFVASRGSRNKCAKARAVLFGLEETSQFYWPPTYDVDADRKAAFGHLVEGVLQQELPEVYNAFKMAGVSWWLLCSGWASDCFLGRLRWPEVCRWLCLAVLFPVDYQVFFFTCLAASRKRQWLEAFNRGRFIVTVYQGDFYDFRLVDYAEYLDGLAKKHQRSISKRLVCEFDLN
ncbi:Protein broad-minded [Cinara cedri]|uniref:Protein broad-minded n=1 Tax=Cinara cedri TaxID=506608 RepID=A0A5E4M2N8_9HEMI|nr:Protein broad-minded [Cinara cedri]